MLFSFCWLFLLTILGPHASENVGTKIVTRQSSPGGVSEETLYIIADRRRLEFRQSIQPENNEGAPEVASRVFILRCDLGWNFHLLPKTEEFNSSPYPPRPSTPEQAEQLGVEHPDRGKPAKLRIETTTVDTGERKEMFGYVARHVITTTKQIPLDEATSQSSQLVTNGWYIDLDLSISCDPKPLAGTKRVGVLEFIDIGARETGLPLKETKTFPMSTIFPDGTRKTYDSLLKTEVIVLERAALDPALFEVPSEYKLVEPSQRRLEE